MEFELIEDKTLVSGLSPSNFSSWAEWQKYAREEARKFRAEHGPPPGPVPPPHPSEVRHG